MAGAGQGARRTASGPVGLDEDRTRTRYFGRLVGDVVRIRQQLVQPVGHPGPRGFQRRHLPHADRRGFRDHGHRRRQRHRSADPQAVRGLPYARRADRHLRQQDGSGGPRSVRDHGRDRTGPATGGHARKLADRIGSAVPGLLRPISRSPGDDGNVRAPPCRRKARPVPASTTPSSTRCCPTTRWPSCARTWRWRAACARNSTATCTCRAIRRRCSSAAR